MLGAGLGAGLATSAMVARTRRIRRLIGAALFCSLFSFAFVVILFAISVAFIIRIQT